jgi:HlyD family secretion protein
MRKSTKRWLVTAVVILVAVGVGVPAVRRFKQSDLPEGFTVGNGRVEATEIDVATKLSGRVKEVLVDEGDIVAAGQIVARMDTQTVEAQLRQAQAQFKQAQDAKASLAAVVVQRQSELRFAEKELQRSRALIEDQVITQQRLDSDETKSVTAKAALQAAKAKVVESDSAIDAAGAAIERIKADLDDSILKAPRGGRVQYRLAEPGEVLAAGGKILTLLDLADVYMTVFLPETVVGKVALGAEARLVFDAAPHLVIPATVSYVAARAQFTPKTVETSTERQKLVFRTKVQIDPVLLQRYQALVKTGVPGVAYIRLSTGASWPQRLEVKLPQPIGFGS